MRKILLDLTKISSHPTDEAILESNLLDRILESYFKDSEKNSRPNSSYFREYGPKSALLFFRNILKRDERTLQMLASLTTQKRDDLLNLVDAVYDYYRSRERYVFYNNSKGEPITHRDFMRRFESLSQSIVSFYRDIYETQCYRREGGDDDDEA